MFCYSPICAMGPLQEESQVSSYLAARRDTDTILQVMRSHWTGNLMHFTPEEERRKYTHFYSSNHKLRR